MTERGGCGMSDDTGHTISWGQIVRDLRVWFGAAGGVAVAFGSVLTFAQPVLDAPETAAEADTTASKALDIAEENSERLDDWGQTLRVVFCTSDDPLSPQAEAQLQCWRVRSGVPPEGR